MSRWLPFPLLSVSLLLIWLLLNQTLAPCHLLLGAVIGLAGGKLLARLQLPATNVKRPAAITRLVVHVFIDIVRSNVAVIRIILLPRTRHATSNFVEIPLEMRSPYGLACLACIITAAPGTCWVDYESRTGRLLVHVLDLIDEAAWTTTVKTRYEQPLIEIFE